jgi:hypothetical protein
MFGRKVAPRLMARLTQACPPLHTSAEVVDNQGPLTPLGNHTADLEAPVGVEVIHHPVVTGHGWPLLDNIAPMGGDIGTGARLAQMPPDWPRRHDKRGEQRSCPMTDIRMLAFFRFAWCHRLRGVCALQPLPTGLCIAADAQTPLRQETQGVEIEGTHSVRFGLKVWVVAVQPIHATRWFEVRFLQQAPETRTTHGPGVTLSQSGHQVVKTPAGGWAVIGGRLTRGHRHHLQTLRGGKSAGADPGAAHLAGP